MTESEFQQLLLVAAKRLGWQTMHIGRTGKHQAVGAKGTLGTGWPDLTLVKGGRLVFAELKGQKADTSPEQKQVLSHLHQVAEVYIWRPSDLNAALDVLAGV